MYLPALADHPIGRITALCGRDPDRTADVAGRWEIPQHFTDWGIMLDKGEVDAVIVASPNESHYEITMAALDRRLPVLCEKPLGMTSDEAAEMADVASRNGVVTMVPFTYRLLPGMWVSPTS